LTILTEAANTISHFFLNLWPRLSFTHDLAKMIQAGKNITLKDDPLQKIQVDYLYNAIRKPSPEIETRIRQLRAVISIDRNRYALLKRTLPYVVCGIFNPPFRRVENFGWIRHFMLDIDHLSEKDLDIMSLKEKLKNDTRIELMFTSPSGDGLKIMLKLSEKCYDHSRYSLFYKIFARKFALQYGIDQVVDSRTSDVTRACFFSVDDEAWFNPDCFTVNIAEYIDFTNPLEAMETANMIRQEEKEQQSEVMESSYIDKKCLDDSILADIKKTLNPNIKLKVSKQIYVPHELDYAVILVTERMNGLKIKVEEIRDIHYGRKFTFSLGLRKAEINLFYGKRGFSVVISPKIGTDKELNEVCSSILHELFSTGTGSLLCEPDNE